MSVSAPSYCDCMCHQSVRGDYNYAWLNEDWHTATRLASSPFVNTPAFVPASDALEAAVASGCSCINRHASALGPPEYLPPSDWTPDADSTGDGAE